MKPTFSIRKTNPRVWSLALIYLLLDETLLMIGGNAHPWPEVLDRFFCEF